MMKRKTFLTSLASLFAAPAMLKSMPKPLRPKPLPKPQKVSMYFRAPKRGGRIEAGDLVYMCPDGFITGMGAFEPGALQCVVVAQEPDWFIPYNIPRQITMTFKWDPSKAVKK